jgi:Cys-tRNA(Pro)/Cys-tRNA(Cys) deacylase
METMSTRAISYLKKKKIPYDVVKYEHREKGAEFAASTTGYPLERTIKTLVVELDRRSYCLALLPGDRELDLKKLASSAGIKRTAMVDIKTAGWRNQPCRNTAAAGDRHGKQHSQL